MQVNNEVNQTSHSNVVGMCLPAHSSYLPPEQLVLANTYQQGIDVSQYWKSEKLDGIRALWDGEHLYTCNGNRIYVPNWFVEKLPKVHLEGELWAGRGNFHIVQSTVLDHTPSDTAWRKIDFMLFDMPGAAGDYQKRYYNILHWAMSLMKSMLGTSNISLYQVKSCYSTVRQYR